MSRYLLEEKKNDDSLGSLKMKKLFVLLRQGNLEEVKRIIMDKPELLNCVAGELPKKDHGQSLLQVAFKSGNLDIAEFLIDEGIDVNFMEAEDDDPGLRTPVLFDAITATIDSLCANKFSKQDELNNKFAASDRALSLLSRMISNGADVNKRSSNGTSALNWTLHHTNQIIKNPEAYPFSQDKVKEQFKKVYDLLLDNGADYETWLKEGSYPQPCPGPSVLKVYFEDENPEQGINYKAVQEMRSILQDYFQKKGYNT
jgi:ankyrin repeat protein